MNAEAPVGSIARAHAVLDAMSLMPDGSSFTEIMARTDFSRTTTHRVLSSLQDVHYVYQDPESRRYHMGSALAQLARRSNQSDLAALCGRSVRRVAQESADTVFLSAPEGVASLCVMRALGDFPIRTLTLEAGDRSPIGVGATGQALFAMMPENARGAALKANANWMADYNVTPALAEECFADFHTRGYALNASFVIPGMSAVALPVIGKGGRAIVAIGIGAINERMKAARIENELLPLLRREVAVLTARFETLDAEGLL